MKRVRWITFMAMLLLGGPLPAAKVRYDAVKGVTAPAVMREFRGAWIATVNNIDWPSRPGLSTAEAQKERR